MQQNKFDIHQPPEGHFDRFKAKLEINQVNKKKSPHNYSWYLIAASLVLLVSLWYNFKPLEKEGFELADVSEQMKETQSYFTSVIESEIKKVDLVKDESTNEIIKDAISRVDLLKKEYSKLSIELKNTGFDKRIINAMIFNFQQRIEILQDLVDQLDNIKTSKNENNTHV